jgi:hypothetical protein
VALASCLLFSIAAPLAALWLAQAFPEPDTQGPPLEWGATTAYVTVEASQERLPEAIRFTYTVRYISASTTGSPIVRFDVGARAFAGAAELETVPITVESPPGWRGVVIPDRSRPHVWQVSWSCGNDWERCLEHHIRAGRGAKRLSRRRATGRERLREGFLRDGGRLRLRFGSPQRAHGQDLTEEEARSLIGTAGRGHSRPSILSGAGPSI